MNRKAQVIIVGGGPAGLATALYIVRMRPTLAGEIVVLEKKRHPRFKTCAGGLIPATMLALEELGLPLETPTVTVQHGVARTPIGDVYYNGYGATPLCTIVRRDLFDARLARAVRSAGVQIIENCAALAVEHGNGGLRVNSEQGIFRAPVVVGADGSGSKVRNSLFNRCRSSIGRALMVDVPIDAARTPEFARNRYRFDFRCVTAGIRGYCWAFPCLVGGLPHLNVGIYDQTPRSSVVEGNPKPSLLQQLREAFPELPLEGLGRYPANFKASPVRWFDPGDRFAANGVLLAGDAAGVDPLMGEGISYAFEHGKLAARAIAGYLEGDAGAFAAYDRDLHCGVAGRKLSKLGFAARWFYGPRHRWFFRLANLSSSAQQIGIDWYNGEGRIDQLPVRALVMRCVQTILFGDRFR